MIVTNGKFITVRQQADIAALRPFIDELFEAWKKSQGLKKALKPDDYWALDTPFQGYKVPPNMPMKFILDFGAAATALGKDDTLEKPGTTFVQAKYEFTPEELDTDADRMATTLADIEKLDAEAKEVMSGFKARKDAMSAALKQLANRRNIGYEMRETECAVMLNFPENKKVFTNAKTGRIVKEEELVNDDFQLQILFE